MQNPAYYIQHLQMLPHPEGGFYKEVYRSEEMIAANALPYRFLGDRNFATSIYFLLENDNFSALHQIQSDEIWHFYAGTGLEVFEIDENTGELTVHKLGQNLADGEVFQCVIKAKNWFGSRVSNQNGFALVGCTVAPGFDFADFELAKAENLIEEYPQHTDLIRQMCRQ